MDIVFCSPRGFLMADRYTVEYDLSEIDSWEELYTYDGDQLLDDDGNEISNLSQDTQQIIVHSAMFAVPVLDEIGIKEWLIRQYLLCNVGCYDCPLSIDSLYRHRNLKTDVEFMTRSDWFSHNYYQLCTEEIERVAHGIYFDFIKEKETEERRKTIKLVK